MSNWKDLSPEVAKELSEAFAGEGVQLPFPAPVFWVINGNASLKAIGDAPFYGGWGANPDDVEQAAAVAGIEVPSVLKPMRLANREGDEYDALVSRSLMAAPIATRQRWNENRSHVQVLAYMATKNGKEYSPWGPVVLSAKGYQARNIRQAFADWERATTPTRRDHAPGIPAWCFFAVIGTFGEERKTVMVGKGQQSPITPIGAWIPEIMSKTHLEKTFVGKDVAERMVELKKQASEWLAEWKKPVADTADPGEPSHEDGWDDQIPF